MIDNNIALKVRKLADIDIKATKENTL